MAAQQQQIQVKLFTYSVIERKDEIEEVSGRRRWRRDDRPTDRSWSTTIAAIALSYSQQRRRVYDTRTSSSCHTSCARAVVRRTSSSCRSRSHRRRPRRVIILFSPLRNTNGVTKRSRASRSASTIVSTTMLSPATLVRTRVKRRSSVLGY